MKLLEKNLVYQGDCLRLMKQIDNKSVDMILCDLPYGTTKCKWDTIIPFELLWEQYERIIKDNGAIVLFGTEPFSSLLRCSNLKLYRYDWIWNKTIATNFMFVNKQPAKKHEIISIFYKNQPTYNPQMENGKPYNDSRTNRYKNGKGCNRESIADLLNQGNKNPIINNGTRFPSSVQIFSNGNNKNVHPTQKPVALCEYLIKTYTNEGELVLDNCCGSGTTAVAALNTNRDFICMEKELKYVQITGQRIQNVLREG